MIRIIKSLEWLSKNHTGFESSMGYINELLNGLNEKIKLCGSKNIILFIVPIYNGLCINERWAYIKRKTYREILNLIKKVNSENVNKQLYFIEEAEKATLILKNAAKEQKRQGEPNENNTNI